MGFFKEFKEFAMKGNVMDMAIGVVIGGAFGKIKQPLRNIASTYNSLMFLDLYKLSVMHNLLNSDE